MWSWLSEYSSAIGVVLSALTAAVWLVYLQLFLSTTMRNRRPMILLSRSAGRDENARLLVSNMGAEPIYLTRLIADMEMDGGTATAAITESEDINRSEDDQAAITEGPLKSGDYMDAGSFGSLMSRIDAHARPPINGRRVNRMTLSLVCSTGHSAAIAAGRRSFQVIQRDGHTYFMPETEGTVQLHGRIERRRLRSRMEEFLRQERDDLKEGAAKRTGTDDGSAR